ncbi:MAG: glutathione peroxidase [Candidatus Cloacimonetes bacterium HGW-Cloacimonetes-2]|nr:MAG: glutathione peroxidase [Candidatus Cloacimonetes bacterium HGW-Cloacimonetes-2]
MDTAKALYDIKVKNIMGIEQSMQDYKGKVLLIVNTASKCGFTKQYDGLQKLYEMYRDKGLEILGFPANNFMYQEPGNDETILNFCRVNFGVNFPLFAKISVRGKNIDPLYQYLTDKESNPRFGGKITWNFNKFLISRDGEIIDRFDSKTEPEDPKLIEALEQALA